MGMYSAHDTVALKANLVKARESLEDLLKNGPKQAVERPGLNREKLLERISEKKKQIRTMEKELEKR